MKLNERASMQVRNGTGRGQPYLSTASTQVGPPGKVIRANKGERFDTGAENQAVCRIDLAKAQALGVEIINQHSEESHKFKTAYDRLFPRDDLRALWRMIQGDPSKKQDPMALETIVDNPKGKDLLSPVKATEGQAERENRLAVLAMLDSKRSIEEVDAIDLKTLPIKRPASEELDEYIYSARKNREVLMDRIPWACLDGIKFTKPFGDIQPGTDFRPANAELMMKLSSFLFDSQNANLNAVWRAAKKAKKAEGESRQ